MAAATMRAEGLAVRALGVAYGATRAVDGVDLDVGDAEIVAVLGPSGCGKSTLLRAIAGLEPDITGSVAWQQEPLDTTPAHQRRFALMFQDYALFPHRDVGGNVEFALRMQRVGAPTRAARVAELLAFVGLSDFERRPVTTLSGGESQRVALARALAADPRLLMLDEPLGSLDLDLRTRLLGELGRLLRSTGVSVLYVTHDHSEAFALADRVAVMRAGRIVQTAVPQELWEAPVSEWVATFLGFGPTVDGRCDAGRVEAPWGGFAAPEGLVPGPVRIVFRPGGADLDPVGEVTGRIVGARFAGEGWVHDVAISGEVVVPVASERLVPSGSAVRVSIDASQLCCFAV